MGTPLAARLPHALVMSARITWPAIVPVPVNRVYVGKLAAVNRATMVWLMVLIRLLQAFGSKKNRWRL